jgi:L-amino acid N-acyltransferase YncA
MSITVRAATEDDMRAVGEIYNGEIANGYATFDIEPKPLEDFLQWLDEAASPFCFLVAEDAGKIVGWGLLKPFRTRAAYRFTVEDSVYVLPEYQWRGVGRAILTRLVELAREAGFHTLLAGISVPNEASERLHASVGMEKIAHEREVGYKFERWIDVVWYQMML